MGGPAALANGGAGVSFQSLLKDSVRVFARTAETETWVHVSGTPNSLPCKITPLSASGARRESRLLEPDVTHTCRLRPNTHIAAGQRLQRQSDKQEFVVRNLRTQTHPVPGQLIIGLGEVENAIT